MNKLFIIGILSLLLVGSVIVYQSTEQDKIIDVQGKETYQGPVPLGYNETHFRETGITILEDNY